MAESTTRNENNLQNSINKPSNNLHVINVETFTEDSVNKTIDTKLSTINIDVESGLKNGQGENKTEYARLSLQGLRAGADTNEAEIRNSEESDVKPFMPEDRRPFIIKTLLLVALGLSITSLAVTIVLITSPLEHWLHEYGLPILIVTTFIYMVCGYVMACYPYIMHGVVGGIIYCIVVICITFLAMMSCVKVDPKLVLMAAGCTCIGVLVAACVAMTKIDLTKCTGVILVLSIVTMILLIVGGLVSWLANVRVVYTIACGFVIILFIIYIILDLQLILGGKRYQLTPQMYFYGAAMLYVDIVMLFLYLLDFIRDVS